MATAKALVSGHASGKTPVDCRDCAHCKNDTDGLYCAHEDSQNNLNIFGLSIEVARIKGRFCGPAGTEFKRASKDALKARGRS